MASQRSAGRGGKASQTVRSSPTARSATSARPRTAQSSTVQRVTAQTRGTAQARRADQARGTDQARGAPRARGAGRAGGAPQAEAKPSRIPLARLIPAAWSPFGQMGLLPLATFVLSLYGLGASIYLTIAHYDTNITLACSDRGLINCAEVTTSSQSMVFGVLPVAVLGLAFYLFMVAINSPWGWRLSRPAVRFARLGSVVVGMGFVLYLVYAEVDQIRAICLWCTSVHIATFLIFVLLVFHTTFNWEKSSAAGRG